MPQHLALIDGDIVAYRTAAVTEQNDPQLAVWQSNQLIERILQDVNAVPKIWISGDNNFRYKLFPDYKANRRDKPKPRHLEVVRENLVVRWNASITDGIEADDALGIDHQREVPGLGKQVVVLCSIDKDLLQLPGVHFNFVNRKFVDVTPTEGCYNFYYQLLVGDSGDNIPGCPGVGPKRAPRMLQECTTEFDMYSTCVQAYTRAGEPYQNLVRNAYLLYVQRKEGDSWKPPMDTSSRPEVTPQQ
jgi:Autographiviridae exonuclease